MVSASARKISGNFPSVPFDPPLVLDYVDLMVAFKVDFAEVILVQEVVGNDQALVVVGEHDVVRAGIRAQVDDACLDGMLGVGYVHHADLPDLSKLRTNAFASEQDLPPDAYGDQHDE
jgi:hypothetical protein